MGLKACIFDVDGVLVRSMEQHAEAYQKAFDLVGVRIAPEEVYANEGRGSRDVIVALAKERGLDLAREKIEELARVKQDWFFAQGPMPLYEGVLPLLDELRRKGLRIAVVTGTHRVNVERHLEAILPVIEVVVSADDVKRTKPDPEPYLSALAKLGLSADEAIVIENAKLGIASAKGAGLPVIAIVTTQPREMLAEADAIVERIGDVWTVLGGWLG